MPPIAKFKKQEIIDAALRIVERDGLPALTARSLGEELGSSPRPIFTVFESMKEVTDEVFAAARAIYDGYVEEGLNEEIAFKGVGKAYIRFAIRHPKFFQMLFMHEQAVLPGLDSILGVLDTNNRKILASVRDAYDIDDANAKQVYLHMWIYSHGIAVLIATDVCSFSPDEISAMLTEVCSSLIMKVKTEGRL